MPISFPYAHISVSKLQKKSKEKKLSLTPLFFLPSLQGHILWKEYTAWWLTNFHQNYQNKLAALPCRFHSPSSNLPSQSQPVQECVFFKSFPVILVGNQDWDPPDITLTASISSSLIHELVHGTPTPPWFCQGGALLLPKSMTTVTS